MSLDTLYQLIYPLQSQHRTRTKPMKILALGLPRTATDSLRVALTTLGCSYVYHGFDQIADASDCVNWVHLWSLKISNQPITRSDFDLVIGHCEAVTDMPACIFAQELIGAYPEAKIIVNYREDVEAWHRSVINVRSTVENQIGWMYPILVWFHAKMFWVNAKEQRMSDTGLFKSDYRKNAKSAYRDHYSMLDELTEGMGKDRVLRFKVQDGWSPLCELLGKEVPDEEFPNRNAVEQVVPKIIEGLMKDSVEAFRNIGLFLGFIVAGTATIIWKYY